MSVIIATQFPFNNGQAPALTGGSPISTSRAEDVADTNLRRRLIVEAAGRAQAPIVTLNAAADQVVSFVSVIGPSRGGAATIELLPAPGNDNPINAGDTALALVADRPNHKVFAREYPGVRRIRVTFPQVPANERLTVPLIVAGLGRRFQVRPQAVRTQLGEWRPERAPRDVQAPAESRGTYRMINVIWTSLTVPDRDLLYELVDNVDKLSSVFFNDDNSSDAPVFGFFASSLDVTDRRFSNFSDARMRITELVAAD